MDTSFSLDRALQAAGELLARRGESAAIVVVGGTALNLLGVVRRATRDVDVIAKAAPRPEGVPGEIEPPEPLPKALVEVVATVARDLGLPLDWLNTTVASQWRTGLPPGFASRITWHQHGGLWLGLAGRLDLIHFKLYAAADDVGPTSRHYTDLVALQPTESELAAAQAWVYTQDPSPAMAAVVHQVVAHVHAERR
ncbi:MAG: DUF6036 family nucleotidyltransferase [Gemmatimonadales bacterium]